jgi:hypothetical protein
VFRVRIDVQVMARKRASESVPRRRSRFWCPRNTTYRVFDAGRGCFVDGPFEAAEAGRAFIRAAYEEDAAAATGGEGELPVPRLPSSVAGVAIPSDD